MPRLMQWSGRWFGTTTSGALGNFGTRSTNVAGIQRICRSSGQTQFIPSTDCHDHSISCPTARRLLKVKQRMERDTREPTSTVAPCTAIMADPQHDWFATTSLRPWSPQQRTRACGARDVHRAYSSQTTRARRDRLPTWWCRCCRVCDERQARLEGGDNRLWS